MIKWGDTRAGSSRRVRGYGVWPSVLTPSEDAGSLSSLARMEAAEAFQTEGLGVSVVLGEVAVDGRLQVDDRGAAAPHSATIRRGGMEGPARMPLEPCLDLWVLAGSVAVDRRVDQLAGRNVALDGVEEADELLVPMALHAASDHRAVEDFESGEQRRRAVALVVVGHGAAAAGFQRQPRSGAVERLDFALFVDRQHHRMRRWIDIEANNVDESVGEPRITRPLERADAMRLQIVCRPDALHRAQRDAGGLRHRPAGIGG